MSTNNDAARGERWGIDNDFAPLRDVLLGLPEFYSWVDAGPLIARTLNNAHKTGVKFDLSLIHI